MTTSIRRTTSTGVGARARRRGAALARLRALTDGYTPPADACNSYRALLDGLAGLESDPHGHIHKEKNVLFPRALEAAERAAGGRVPSGAVR